MADKISLAHLKRAIINQNHVINVYIARPFFIYLCTHYAVFLP